MRLKINPTRMELLRLRRRVEIARRGHKLLKDKLDGLMQRFFTTRKEYLALHTKLEPELARVFSKTIMTSALSNPLIEKSVVPAQISLETSIKNIMGVRVPSHDIKIKGKPAYNELLATVEMREGLDLFIAVLPDLVKLAALNKTIKLLAAQIIDTRRRVNALEYVLIPELERNLRFIHMQLSERERSTRVVLLKISEEG